MAILLAPDDGPSAAWISVCRFLLRKVARRGEGSRNLGMEQPRVGGSCFCWRDRGQHSDGSGTIFFMWSFVMAIRLLLLFRSQRRAALVR